MRGIVFPGDRTAELREFPDPTPEPRDVVLEIRASGMCGSDLHAYRAPAGEREVTIAGHEPCGVVVEVGSAVTEQEARVGDRVMVHHYDGCGVCRHCRSGWTQLCEQDVVFFGSGTGHGGHAPYMRAPAHTLVPLPDALSFPAGSAVACGTGTAYGALERLDLRGDETIAVFGQGPVGLSATHLASVMGARVLAIDISAERRQLALEWGADLVIDPQAEDQVALIKEATHGEGAHKALDTSAAPSARLAAVRATRTWGAVALVGIGGDLTVDVFDDLIKRQLTVMGHLTFSKEGQADCATFVADRGLDLDRLFTHRWTLDQAEEAYRLFDQQKTGKGWFDPTATAS
jgi:threonine dehydrogenase-like Zn-dependent dehydrogenase